jgi:NAD-dependent deacetylase
VPLISEAANIVQNADIFVVIGTSLVVYPAAGLVNETKMDIPVFVVDKSLPEISNPRLNLITIEAPATTGIQLLKEQLANLP